MKQLMKGQITAEIEAAILNNVEPVLGFISANVEGNNTPDCTCPHCKIRNNVIDFNKNALPSVIKALAEWSRSMNQQTFDTLTEDQRLAFWKLHASIGVVGVMARVLNNEAEHLLDLSNKIKESGNLAPGNA
jgi:hypothetical protein